MGNVEEMVGCPTFEGAVQGLGARMWFDVFMRYPDVVYCRVSSLEQAVVEAEKIQADAITESFKHPEWYDRVIARRWKLVDGKNWKEDMIPDAWERVIELQKIAQDNREDMECEKAWEELDRERRKFSGRFF